MLRAVPDDPLGAVERPLYLTAAMTGLRQGELLALRWSDVDRSKPRSGRRELHARGVRLAEVHADRVVLDRNGTRETLAWPAANRDAAPARSNK